MDNLNKIIECLNYDGFYKTNIEDLIGKDNFYYKSTKELLYTSIQKNSVKKTMNQIKANKGGGKPGKFYEMNQIDLLGRGLKIRDNVIQLYLEKPFLKIAKTFLKTDNVKMFNVLTWCHPETNSNSRIKSQNWHRDKEDRRVLKCFIYYNDINSKNGALDFCVGSQYGGRNEKISNKNNIPNEHVITAKGKKGTVYFINTSGYHRGGFVKSGIRLMTHAIYLRPDAELIKNGYFSSFNYNKKICDVDFNGSDFLNLPEESKEVLTK